MDFKSTIFIFVAALIFILPLAISSSTSGAGGGVEGKSMGNENYPKSDSINISFWKIIQLLIHSEGRNIFVL